MKLVLTSKEVVALGEYALKMHHVTGSVLVQCGEKLDAETLAKTDRELLDEVVAEAIESIESIGGTVSDKFMDEYVVTLPEMFVLEQLDKAKRVTGLVAPIIVKAHGIWNKHKEFLMKGFNYAKAMARYIFESPESKEVEKDVDNLIEMIMSADAQIDEIMKARG